MACPTCESETAMKLNRDMLYLAAIAALLIATMLPGIG
jgi:hypothetical protein